MCVRLSDSEYGDSIGGLERIPSKERANSPPSSDTWQRDEVYKCYKKRLVPRSIHPSIHPSFLEIFVREIYTLDPKIASFLDLRRGGNYRTNLRRRGKDDDTKMEIGG